MNRTKCYKGGYWEQSVLAIETERPYEVEGEQFMPYGL
jgi:hypothetical protein